jgi:hypothetical protein
MVVVVAITCFVVAVAETIEFINQKDRGCLPRSLGKRLAHCLQHIAEVTRRLPSSRRPKDKGNVTGPC